jgi:hypothetical protein
MRTITIVMSNEKQPDVIYSRIMAVFESQALLLEGAEESVNLLLGDLDLSSLEPDQRVALQNWHKGIQQATKVIRCPE